MRQAQRRRRVGRQAVGSLRWPERLRVLRAASFWKHVRFSDDPDACFPYIGGAVATDGISVRVRVDGVEMLVGRACFYPEYRGSPPRSSRA
jgi:hypothetical protein